MKTLEYNQRAMAGFSASDCSPSGRQHLDLFSGIGGFALAARMNQVQTVAFVYGRDREPWDVPDDWLETLCHDCHSKRTQADAEFRLRPSREVLLREPELITEDAETPGPKEPEFHEMFAAEPTCFVCIHYIHDLCLCSHHLNHKGRDSAVIASPNATCEHHEFD